jgi:hypothetical protein
MDDRSYYFFFDKDGMPIAVFYTFLKGEAFDLFARLYRRPWSESVKLGITIEKETDVPVERWDEIHRKYIAKVTPKPLMPVIKPVIPRMKPPEQKRMESTGLETEKYLTRM